MQVKDRPQREAATQRELIAILRKMNDLEGEAIVDHIRQAIKVALPSSPMSPLADALFRGIEAQRKLRESEGGSLGADDVARLLGLKSRQAVFDRYKSHRLIGWREKQEAVRFPAWQFRADGELLAGLEEILKVLAQNPHLDDWAKVLFFLNPRESLKQKKPLDLLREGKVDRVKALAQAYVE